LFNFLPWRPLRLCARHVFSENQIRISKFEIRIVMMTSAFFALKKFFCLSGAERRLLLKAMLLICAVRLMLRLLPFRMVRELLTKLSHKAAAGVDAEQGSIERVAWAVTVSSRYVPAATCLTQALVTKLLLARFGHHATVRIGVARSDAGEMQAHAWVESSGKIVIGGSESSLQRYTPLATANGELW
jgi:hypothetical protein